MYISMHSVLSDWKVCHLILSEPIEMNGILLPFCCLRNRKIRLFLRLILRLRRKDNFLSCNSHVLHNLDKDPNRRRRKISLEVQAKEKTQ